MGVAKACLGLSGSKHPRLEKGGLALALPRNYVAISGLLSAPQIGEP